MPLASPPRTMFSRPVRASLKPRPGVSRLSRPCTVIRPASGGRMPVMTRHRVDLPAPLRPMTASTEPLRTSNDTSRKAGMIRAPESSRRNKRRRSAQNVGRVELNPVRSRDMVDLDRAELPGVGLLQTHDVVPGPGGIGQRSILPGGCAHSASDPLPAQRHVQVGHHTSSSPHRTTWRVADALAGVHRGGAAR